MLSRTSRAALAAAFLSAGFGIAAPPVSDRRTPVVANAPKRRHDPYRHGGPFSSTRQHARVPFSSSRQHARAARLYMKTMPNGHVVMQMAGSGAKTARRLARARRAA